MHFNLGTFVLVTIINFLVSLTDGLYIRNAGEIHSTKMLKSYSNTDHKDEWSILKQRLGLSSGKVELLKSQKDQQGTLKLLKRFIEENPTYSNEKGKVIEAENMKPNIGFWKVYRNILKQLKLSRSIFKTSLNFELADKPEKNFKRSPRKIAVKVVSDIPSTKIDALLKMFNEKHGIKNHDNDDEIDDEVDISERDDDYRNFPSKLPSAIDPDYMYENLYEDEEDLAVPAKSNQNSQYGSLQDLILQASKNQWKQEMEETKLRHRNNEHFI